MRCSASILLTAALASAAAAAPAEAGSCKAKGKAPEVFVKASTPLRRGPGLNYPVAAFLEKAQCAAFTQVSFDRQWVLVSAGEKMGWVPAGRLSAESQARVAEVPVEEGAVGSGQKRGFAQSVRATVMRERPEPDADQKRAIPEGLELLPLAATPEGDWVQVRDERAQVGWIASADLEGPTLANLPRIAVPRGGDRPEVGPSTGSFLGETRVGAALGAHRDGSASVSALVVGAAAMPLQRFDSNGVRATRRYDLSAFAPATGFEVQITDLGPLSMRGNYQIGFLSGVTPEGRDDAAISGFQQDASLRIGVPLVAGDLLVTPEFGYAFGMFEVDAVIPGQLLVTFVSTQSHAVVAGGRLQYLASPSLMLEADLGLMGGLTVAGPMGLGDAGPTLGGSATVGLTWFLTEGLGFIARYGGRYRRTGFSGQAELDPTITEATLTDLSHGVSLGVWFAIPG